MYRATEKVVANHPHKGGNDMRHLATHRLVRTRLAFDEIPKVHDTASIQGKHHISDYGKQRFTHLRPLVVDKDRRFVKICMFSTFLYTEILYNINVSFATVLLV